MNETVKETAKEVLNNFTKIGDIVTEPVKQRIAHPFIGSFAISWLFFNWKPIAYFIMANNKIEDRIKYIDMNFYQWNHLFAYPLLTAVFYTLILKWFDTFSDEFNKIPNARKSKSIADNKIEVIKNDIRIVKEQKRLENAKAENKELEELNFKIELLTKELEIKEEQNSGLQQNIFRNLDELKFLEKDNNEIQTRLVSLSNNLENLKKDNKEGKIQLFSIVKEVMPPNQFRRVIEIMRKTTSDFFTDHDLRELLADFNNEKDQNKELVLFTQSINVEISDKQLKRIKQDLINLNQDLRVFLTGEENEMLKIEVIGHETFSSDVFIKEIERIILKHTIGTL